MITSLSYVGFESPAVDAWRSFGPEVLGAELVDHPDNAVALRFDERAARLVIHQAETDDLVYVGWDCGNEAGLTAAAERVEAAGFDTSDEPDTAELRDVAQCVSFTDPFGFRHELSHGLAEVGPLQPGRPLRGGFVTGDGGLGHLVMMVPDLDAGMAFYVDVLGFLVSDHIEAGMSLRFLHCNPRHHSIALAAVPGMAGVHHLMVEVDHLDDVGTALDIVNEREMSLAMTLGRHTNDLMTSFYVRTPSGFEIEYGTGGVLINDDEWQIETHNAQSLWGHKTPDKPLRPGILRPVNASR